MILVTGATGFLGSHLVCQLLAKGENVRACKRQTSDSSEFNFVYDFYFPAQESKMQMEKNLQWVRTDVLEIDTFSAALEGISAVYHCAALVSFDPKDRELLQQTNVEGTANVVNLCLTQGVKNLSYVSSIASLGRTKTGNTMDESCKWESSKLNSNYAISKYQSEMEVWRGSEEGLNVAMVNPGVIIGPGNFNKGSNELIKSVYNGMPLYSLGVNGYVDVRDVARALIELTERKIYSKRFILVGANLSIKDLFFSIADGFGKKRPYILITPFLAALSWRVMWVLRLFTKKGLAITKETARAAINESYYKNDAIIKEIAFTFTPIETTIKDCCKTYLTFINSKI